MSETDQTRTYAAALYRARWALRWTLAGLWVERITRAFWPVWTIALALIAALALGLQDALGDVSLTLLMWAAIAAMVGFLGFGIWRFRRPHRAEALARIDARLAGRPFAALADAQATGTADSESTAVWRIHMGRMAARASAARPVAPDLRIAARDPFGLRHAALVAFVIAMMFGSPGRLIGVAPQMPLPAGPAVAAGPAWEGWIQPPVYTGKPALYLNEIDRKDFSVPQGSKLTLRLYGTPGAVKVTQSLSDKTAAPDAQGALSLTIDHTGSLSIQGAGGRDWTIDVAADTPPTVRFVGTAERRAGGEMRQPFSASDDYGVVKGHATIRLDLAAVDRRYGLAVAPEPRDPITLTLPMPISGSRTQFTETLTENLAKSPWANLPVDMTLTVEDAAGHIATTPPKRLDLPGRRFFDPLAAAVIEMRRDLLWSRANGARTVDILRAITDRPEGFVKDEGAYLLIRIAMRRLQVGVAEGLTPQARDDVAEALWDAAVRIEDGTLSDALAQLRQAQDRLSEAIRRGASPDEVQKLMDDLNEAMKNYIRRLAEQQQQNQGDKQSADNQNTQHITGDQLQQMLNRLQQLMNEGRTAEAQQLLDQLSQMMQNLRVTQGQNGMQMPGQGQMQGLADTLKKQQNLSDQAFQDLQKQGQGGQEGQQPGQQSGQQPGLPGQQQGQNGQGQQPGQQQGQGGGGDRQALAQRQRQLREELRRQSEQGLPGAGTPDGKAGREALGRAGRAMEGAEKALRDDDLSGALDKQAEAMEALRQGMRNLGRAMAQNQQPNQGQQGAQGQTAQQGSRDPLGRETGTVGRMGTNQDLLQGEDIYRRAEEILKELRRRSGDMSRPEQERDYLKRLLDPY